MTIIIITGPPSSGKGTEAQLIEQKFDIKHISMGQLLREETNKKTRLGNEIASIINKGLLVPDQLTNELASKSIKKFNNVLFDGYPRTMEQAKFLKKNYEIKLILNIEVDDETIIKRMTNRRTCIKCGEVYNLITNPPPNGKCKCGGDVIQRKDDKPEILKNRIKIYEEQTKPMIKEFESIEKNKKGIIKNIDGKKSISQIDNEITKILEQINLKKSLNQNL